MHIAKIRLVKNYCQPPLSIFKAKCCYSMILERYFLSFCLVKNPEERFFLMLLNKSIGIDFSKLYSMDDSLDFTDDEIREELCKLGYSSVPDTKLEEFKKGIVYRGKDTEFKKFKILACL